MAFRAIGIITERIYRYRCHVIFLAKWGVSGSHWLSLPSLAGPARPGFRTPDCNVRFIVFPDQEDWRVALAEIMAGSVKFFRKLPNAIYLIGSKSLGAPRRFYLRLWLWPVITPSHSLSLSFYISFSNFFPGLAECKVTCWRGEFYDLNAIYGANSLWQWQSEQVESFLARQSNGPGLRPDLNPLTHALPLPGVWLPYKP